MSDRMDKQAMDKFYTYMKSYYPPGSYPMRNPYYPLPEEKERKSNTEPYSMYGYPAYPHYLMPHMGYSQPYPESEHKKHEEDKHGHEMANHYHYYPYSPYPYYNPYAYSHYYGQRDFSAKNMPHPPPPTPPAPIPGQLHYPSLYHPHQSTPQVCLTKSFLKQDVLVKQQIVISSDSEAEAESIPKVTTNATVPPPSQQIYTMPQIINPIIPLPIRPEVFQEEKTPQKKGSARVNIEQAEQQPFLIQKNKKILKQPRTIKTKPYQRIPVNTRYNGMPTEAYQEMIKKQTRMRLELFYERERERRQQEKLKQAEKETVKQEKVEDKKSSEERPEKERKIVPIYRISAPSWTGVIDDKDSKKQRIKDDHPLKELRYNQSHGRIRLGAYFQSNVPTLLPHQDLAIRRVELQKKLRQRQISAITF